MDGGVTFCSTPLQSRDTARLANREKASFWTALLSAATPEASFMTQCMREPLGAPRPVGAPPEPAHRELQAEER